MIKPIKIDGTFQVIVEREASFDDTVSRHVDSVWDKAKAGNASLFDGKTLAVDSITERALRCAVVPYKYFFAQQKDPSAEMKPDVQLVGVSGIVRWRDNVLFGKRGAGVTQYPGSYELVPSGSLPAADLGALIDYRAHLLEELKEETGIDESVVTNCRPVLLIVDDADSVVDICCVIEIASHYNIHQNFVAGEYQHLQYAPLADIRILTVAHRGMWVPTSAMILQNLSDSFDCVSNC